MNGGRFDFDDGGTYCGGWEDGKAHGHGVCTGPKGQGEYAGAWHYGFEVSGIYVWPSGNTYGGQWQNGKRHGLGVEQRGRWLYRGEWTQGYKGRYGIRQSTNSHARYEGTWSSGLQDGYGTETYADGGTYQGQWLRGMRHGYGIRKSAAYGVAAKFRSRSHAHASLTSLRSEQGAGEDDLQDKEKRSVRSSGSTMSCTSDESGYDAKHDDALLPAEDHVDANTIETYMGEWKNDKRSGFGISERSDGLKYEGEWFNNKKFGYGVTTMKDGAREEGKYKNNILVTSQRKKHLLFVRSSKLRERIDAATQAANRAAQIALQKADIAISRMATARDRAEQADYSYEQARADSDLARIHAKQFDPTFHQPGTELMKRGRYDMAGAANHVPYGADMQMQQQQQQFRPQQMRLPHQESLGGGGAIEPYDPTAAIMGVEPGGEQMLTPYNTPPTEFKQLLLTQQQQQPLDVVPTVMVPNAIQPADLSVVGDTTTAAAVAVPQSMVAMSPTGGPPVVVHSPPPLDSPMKPPAPVAVAAASPPGPSTSSTSNYAPAAATQPKQVVERPTTVMPPSTDQQAPAVVANNKARFASQVEKRQFTPHADEYQDFGDVSATSSRTSLNLWNDHFDQYVRVANPSAGKLYEQNMAARRGGGGGGSGTPSSPSGGSASPSSHPMGLPAVPGFSDSSPTSGGGGIVRRTTMGSSRDWKSPAAALKAAHGSSGAHDDSATTTTATKTTTTTAAGAAEVPAGSGALKKSEEKGSLPDVRQLNEFFGREDASRMSSQRRQELLRMQEEEELLRTNPLRYLFHPAVREWVIRWKLPLLVVLVNVCLSIMFYQLLTYNDDDDDNGGADGNDND